MEWETVIGLETHAQLSTQSKMFSGASTAFGAAPNTQASAVDIALPGVLPVANRGAVERAIRFGLAVGGTIRRRSVFARKNYFYPDLPKGYQISQFEAPIVEGGAITIVLAGGEKTIRLTRAHLEEDAGKLLHEIAGDAHSARSHGMTGVDLNRAGIPLLEIVTEPDMRSAEEAVTYARALHGLVRWIDICDGNMQEGSFRCDANVSVRRKGEPLGTRCEIKNLNSFRFLERAIVYEARRQIEILEGGGRIVQETRLYDPDRDETRSMRTKEDAHDYRYFPDPDLLPLAVSEEWIEEVRVEMPELPQAKRTRFQAQYGLPAQDTATLTSTRSMSEYFDRTVARRRRRRRRRRTSPTGSPGDLSAKLNETGKDAAESAVGPTQLARLIALVHDGTISRKIAKEVFDAMWAGEGGADAIIDEAGPAADLGRRRARGDRRRSARREPEAGRGLPRREGEGVQLARRPGDEGDEGQGEPGAGERAARKANWPGVSRPVRASLDPGVRRDDLADARSVLRRGFRRRRGDRGGPARLHELAVTAQILVVLRVDHLDLLLLLVEQLGVRDDRGLVHLDVLLELRGHRLLLEELGLDGELLLPLLHVGELAAWLPRPPPRSP